MIFAGEDKAFIRIFTELQAMNNGKLSEFLGKGRKTFGLDNVIMKLLKNGTSKRKRGVPILRTHLSRRLSSFLTLVFHKVV